MSSHRKVLKSEINNVLDFVNLMTPDLSIFVLCSPYVARARYKCRRKRKSKTAFDNRASVGGVLEAPSAELLPAPLHEAGGARDHSSGRHDRWSRRACRAPCVALLVTGVFSHGAQGGGRAEMTSFSTAVGSWPKRDEEAFERGKQVPTHALASLLACVACVPVNTAPVWLPLVFTPCVVAA